MDLSPKQQKRYNRLESLMKEGEVAILAHLFDIEEKLDETLEDVDTKVKELESSVKPDMMNVLEQVKGKDGVTPIKGKDYFDGENGKDGMDGCDYVLTEKDKKEIAKKVTVPVVEKIIEKTEIVREKPVVTEVTKNIENPVTPIEIVDKLESLEGNDRLDKKAIKGLDDYEEISRLAKQPKTGGGFFGTRYLAGDNITIEGNTISATGGGTPGGSDTQVQFNDSSSFSGDAGFTYNKTTDVATIGGVKVSGLTVSEIVITDASKNLVSAAVATYPSLTELTYVKGVTSAIQTQLGTKAPSTSPTFATSITGSYLTASELVITDGSKNIVSAPVATYPSLTELTYLKGVTSAIQTQINAKTIETPGFTIDGGGSAITTGKVKGFFTVPYAGTITGWSMTLDAGTATVKVWKIATGTAKPTSANSINTSGVGISSGTAIRSSTVSDFTTTTVSVGDILAYNIEAVATATELTFNLEITK